jgi:hypothetical protein
MASLEPHSSESEDSEEDKLDDTDLQEDLLSYLHEYTTEDPVKEKKCLRKINNLLEEKASPTAAKIGKDSAYEIAFDEDHTSVLKAFNSSCEKIKCDSEQVFYMDLHNSPDTRPGISPIIFVGYFKNKRIQYAIKRIQIRSDSDRDQYKRELDIMRKMQRGGGHRNILSLIDWAEKRKYCYIITELCIANLQQIVDDDKELINHLFPEGMTKENLLDLVKQLVEGVSFMQLTKLFFIVHRDLKPKKRPWRSG